MRPLKNIVFILPLTMRTLLLVGGPHRRKDNMRQQVYLLAVAREKI